MKRTIIAVLTSLALATPAYALHSANHDKGVGVGHQGDKGPKGPKGDTPTTTPGTPTEEQPAQGGQRRSNKPDYMVMLWVGGILLGFMCEREFNREDKTDFVTEFCTPGEMPDAFESFAQ